MKVHWRDRLAYFLANAALKIATPWYRKMAHGAWLYGLNAAARDEEEGRELPPDVMRQLTFKGEDNHDW